MADDADINKVRQSVSEGLNALEQASQIRRGLGHCAAVLENLQTALQHEAAIAREVEARKAELAALNSQKIDEALAEAQVQAAGILAAARVDAKAIVADAKRQADEASVTVEGKRSELAGINAELDAVRQRMRAALDGYAAPET